jgi:hypothetical protein
MSSGAGRGRGPSGAGPASGPPTDFANVPPQTTPMLDHSFTLQAVLDLAKSVAQLGAKTDRLIQDVESQGKKLDGISHQVSFVKGALWVLGALFALVALVPAVLDIIAKLMHPPA